MTRLKDSGKEQGKGKKKTKMQLRDNSNPEARRGGERRNIIGYEKGKTREAEVASISSHDALKLSASVDVSSHSAKRTSCGKRQQRCDVLAPARLTGPISWFQRRHWCDKGFSGE